jgi:hypothetical protein
VTLLCSHGIEPSAVKSDLYTLAGIDSHHPSKLRSSIWRPDEVVQGGKEEIKVGACDARPNRQKMKDEYYSAKTKSAPKQTEVKKDGFLNSDSEDERVLKAQKRKVDPEQTKTKVAKSTKYTAAA